MASNSTVWLNHWLAKALFGGVILFAAIVGGVYVGHSLTSEAGKTKVSPSSDPHAGPWVKFGPGDAFPLEPIWAADGRQVNVEDLFRDQRSIVFYVHFGCDPCLDLLKFWNRELLPRVVPGTQVFLMLSKGDETIPPEYLPLVRNMRLVTYDKDYWESVYHVSFMPMIVTIDGSSIVNHVQLGFENGIDYEIARDFLLPPK